MSAPIYDRVTALIVSALERDLIPWRKPWSLSPKPPVNAISERPYRGVNLFLLGLNSFVDHRWLTFRQAVEAGGSIKKGEEASMIVFWKQWQVPQAEGDEAENPRRRKSFPVLRHYNVFNVEQTSGLNLALPESRTSLTDAQRMAAVEEFLVSIPNPPRFTQGRSAAYSPLRDLVMMPPFTSFRSVDTYYATYFHELAHATGHESRLDRPSLSAATIQPGEYGQEELVAEFASAFLCGKFGLDNSFIEDSASYIQHWTRVIKADPKLVLMAAGQAQKAADYLQGVFSACPEEPIPLAS